MSNTARHAPTIESLATETMQHILLFAFSPFTLPKGTTDYALMKRYAWFASVARISRSWPAVVYPLLYKSVVLLTNRAAGRFLRTLRHASTLRAVVRILVLPGWTGVDLEIHKTWSGPRQSVYRDIARLCTEVRTIAVGNAYRETVLSSKAPWIDDVKDLRIMTITGDCTVPRLPSLRILRLYGPQKALLTSGRIDFGPVGNLETLQLRSMVFGRTHHEAVLSLCTNLTTLMCTRVLVRTLPTGPPVFVSPSEWTMPLRRTLTTLSLSGCSPVRTLRELKMLTTLYVDIAALPTTSVMEGGAWLPESLVEVTITTAASQNLQMRIPPTLSFSPWVYARRAWEVIQSDETLLPQLKIIRLHVDVYRESSIRTFTFCSFLLRELAQDRDRAFEMSLDVKFYRDGDSFDWSWPKFELPPRPSPLKRLSALLKGKNRQLFRISRTMK